MPYNFTIEVVQLETLSEEGEDYNPTDNPVVEANAVNKVNEITTVTDLLEVGLDLGIDDDILEGREPTTLGSLELPINETLQRGLRSRTKSRKVRTNYILADMLIALARAFYMSITVSEPSTITIPTSYKESQTLPEAAQQRAAVYVEIRIHNRNQTQRHSRRRDVQRVLRRRQVFICKRGPNRKFSRFKVRWYIRGFS